MILFEVKTYVAVCFLCRKESEPFTSRRERGHAVPKSWAVAQRPYTKEYGLESDIEYVCPDCIPKTERNGWELTMR